ncbi:mannitol-1-phosphate 5-dehydrogenase [Thalassobacillus pellis]|uniref:mannitol-1-phosphate 5-dehydrogenase n=1 Tax=Thalassobacillus pellis TaxID=748008 RepID=UPI0019621A9B|nr:mannitol-1-phosphate 5-dehydrogenase [Thalassobacillus pellis]MBM7552243.1 mannitol-1-phosphate 5-dehydrogenase [Thalassobacillus pellis]
MKALHFGAGNIGRGFIGALLSQSGYDTTFVDVDEKLIQLINERKSYHVEIAGSNESIQVNNIAGLNSLKQQEDVIEAIAEADLVTTAVGPAILKVIAPLLAKGLEKVVDNGSRPLNVIACENMIEGSSKLRGYVLNELDGTVQEKVKEQIGFPDAAVDRIVPEQKNQDPLTVKVEPYHEWVVETKDIRGDLPEITGIHYVGDLTPYIERKLYTVNTGHAVAAYLGHYHGLETIKEAMDDPAILEKVRGTLGESGDVLIKKYQFDESEHHHYVDKIIERFLNPALSDYVTRVGRAPIRKLGPDDRLVGPGREYVQLFKKAPDYLAEVIASALLYQNDSDPEAEELQKKIKAVGAIEAFTEIADLPMDHPLTVRVKEIYNQLSN